MWKPLQLIAFAALISHGSFAQNATYLSVQDTRNDATTPSSYINNLQLHFKNSNTLGLNATGNYTTILGLRGWNDNTGGKSHELAFTNDNILRIRSGYSSTWENWRRVITEDNNGHVFFNGNIQIPNNTSYFSLGGEVFPYGSATIGHGSGKNALIYHKQIQSGTTLKVDIDSYNFSPAVHVSGSGAYLNGGLFNVDYSHLNYAYVTAAYKANLSGTATTAGGTVVGFQGATTTVAGYGIGGHFTTSSSGTGTAMGVYIDSYLSGSNTGRAFGVYVNRGKSYFGENVGIGTENPVAKLHLSGGQNGSVFSAPTIALGYSTTGQYPHFIHTRHNGSGTDYNAIDFYTSDGTAAGVFPTNAIHAMTISNGAVSIGTTNPVNGYKLIVDGTVGARKLKITQSSTWADYVFEPTYQLPTLQEVEAFIKVNKHLPGVPSAAQVAKEGLDVGDNQATLLKKIEELTLYMIELKKQVDEQKVTITDLKEQLQSKK